MESNIIEFDMGEIHCILGNPLPNVADEKVWGIKFTKDINGEEFEIAFPMSEQTTKEVLLNLINAVRSFNRAQRRLQNEIGVKNDIPL